jgi:type II secretory pathway component GspD/PulD (secretin)
MTAGITSPTFTTRSDVYNSSAQIGYYPFSGTTSSLNSSVKVTPGENLHVGIIDRKRDFDTLINYLKTLGKTKIIASPSLAVINNQEAKIHIGERRAYVTTTTTTGTTTKTVSEEVTYINVGVTLSVTPTINDDGYVIMNVKPEISNVISNITTSSGNIIPVLDTNTAETTVIAKDGTTVILGGLGREEIIQEQKGFPILSKIPILGFFFRSGTKAVERVELVIMLTPIIFEGDKFITPKDKEKFDIKPTKSFDVFKPEVPSKESYPIMKDLKPQIPLSRKEDYKEGFDIKLVSKGFKTYDIIDRVDKKEPSKETVLDIKGFRPYD